MTAPLPPPLVDLTHVAALVAHELDAAPAVAVGAALRDGDSFLFGLGVAGRLTRDPASPLATADTVFDLASLTKPVTALALARLERAGVLARAELLGDVLPSLAESRSGRAPLDLLCAHRAGLDGHRTLYSPLLEGARVDAAASLRVAADARRPDCEGEPPPDGFAPVYSDLGYLLVGAAIAARASDDLDAVLAREVLAPLRLRIGSARQLGAREPSVFSTIAPTEDVPWRGGVVRGAVHDENAWALGGEGTCGHAGLFGDVASVTRLGAAILDALGDRRPEWLGSRDLAPLLRARPDGSHRAGFDSKSGDAPSSGALFGPRTFGHLGFTGTSLWIDPDAGLAGVLLTNRVHPTRAHLAIRAARPAAYDAIHRAMHEARASRAPRP
jgi:CubicO group peptidase (beta-lactamase class C family)